MLDEIDDVRVEDFIISLKKAEDSAEILSLKKYARDFQVPIIREETKDFLKLILSFKKCNKILEIGTAIGYSTILINNYTCGAEIDTIEDFEKRVVLAKENLKNYENINLIPMDATIFLENIEDREIYDFIFLDAAKGQYINWLPKLKKILKKDGILLADNIFKDGEILESKFLIKKRDRTIHKRMREFLYTIANDIDLDTQIFNIGDGISISRKIK